MLKYMENLYEVRIQRKNACKIKDGVMYFKWAFPTAKGGFNLTYAEKFNKTVFKNIVHETQNYKTVLTTPLENLHKKYPDILEFSEEDIVYGLEQKLPFKTGGKLTFKTVKGKEDLILWGQVAAQIYDKYDADFIYESFKADLRKKYADYFIFYKGKTPVSSYSRRRIFRRLLGRGFARIPKTGLRNGSDGADLESRNQSQAP